MNSEILAPPTHFAAPKTAEDVPRQQRMCRKQKTKLSPKEPTKTPNGALNYGKPGQQSAIPRQHKTTFPLTLLVLTMKKKQSCLSLFVLEARKKDGSEYPSQTLHHIVCGLVSFLQ